MEEVREGREATLMAVILLTAISGVDSVFLSSPAYPRIIKLLGLDLHFVNSITPDEATTMLRQIRLGLAKG